MVLPSVRGCSQPADPKLDGTVFLFAFLLSLATGFIFGVVPPLRASKTGLVESLKEETTSPDQPPAVRASRRLLLAGQVAFSLISLIAASLFLRAVQRAYDIDQASTTSTSPFS